MAAGKGQSARKRKEQFAQKKAPGAIETANWRGREQVL
jgi:hypothetical protein